MPRAGLSQSDLLPGPSGSARAQALAIVVSGVIGLGVLLLVAPEQLDRMPQLCLWAPLVGRPCPACGTVHALCCLVHGDFRQAVHHNCNVVVLAPVLALVWVAHLRVLWRARSGPFRALLTGDRPTV
jgi:hypothetical protein